MLQSTTIGKFNQSASRHNISQDEIESRVQEVMGSTYF
jgi:hypothetical protein